MFYAVVQGYFKQLWINNKIRETVIIRQRYLQMAHIWAQNSYCKRRQVGALLVKDKMIISDGYNGTPSGFEIFAKTNKAIQNLCITRRSKCNYKDCKGANSSKGATYT